MPAKHPIIAITGSSGAGTTSVTRTFEQIFRRESVEAAIIEGDSFHRYDRVEMKKQLAQRLEAGDQTFSHFGPEANLFAELDGLFHSCGETGSGLRRRYLHDEEEARPYNQSPGTFTEWETLPQAASQPLIHHAAVIAAGQAEVADSLARFEQMVDHLKGLTRGRLRLAGVTSAEYFLPRLLGPFCAAHPGIEVQLLVANREEVLDRLRRGDDDLSVFGQPPDDMAVESAVFLENPLTVVAPDGHRLTGRPVPLSELAAGPLLMRERGSGTRMAVERLLGERGLTARVRMELGSTEAIKQAVLGGLGLAVVPRLALATSVGLTELTVEGFPLMRHWYLVRPAGKPLSLAARALTNHLTEKRDGAERSQQPPMP